MPVLRAFMDDVSLMTTSTPVSKIALQRTVVALKWARMELKPQKSRSLVIKGDGRSEEEDQGDQDEGIGVSEFVTCDDWMAINDLRNISILGGISRGLP